MRLLGAYIYSKDNNTFFHHGRQHRRPKQQKELPTMHAKVFATKRPNKESFAWDAYVLPFVVENSATAIVCNVRKVFTGKLIPTKIILETAEGTGASKTLVGIICLVLTDNKKEHHTYNIPGRIYDPDFPISILGIPALEFFSMMAQILTTLSTTTEPT